MRDELETPRLLLRRWRPDDLDALARWHVDPELMRHMGKPSFTREEMEAADILYGVTMAGDGVSQIVSRRLSTHPRSVTHALSA